MNRRRKMPRERMANCATTTVFQSTDHFVEAIMAKKASKLMKPGKASKPAGKKGGKGC